VYGLINFEEPFSGLEELSFNTVGYNQGGGTPINPVLRSLSSVKVKVKSQDRISVGQRSSIDLYSVYHDQYFSDGCMNIILQKNLLEIGQESSEIFGKSQESRPIF